MDWSEEGVRREAGWQAFKAGKELAQRGAIEAFQAREHLLTGAFRAGRRTIRTVVRRDAGHLEAECGCEANRRRGEICRHAVALVLTAAGSGEARRKPTPSPPAAAELPTRSLRLVVPAKLDALLDSGRLPLRVEVVDGEPDEADRRFAAWLALASPGDAYPKMLSLRGDEIGSLLVAARAHPRVCDESGARLRIAHDPREPLELSDSSLHGSRLCLKLAGGGVPIPWGSQLGLLERDRGGDWILARLPVRVPSAAWRDEASEWIREGQLELELETFAASADAWLDLIRRPAPGWIGRLRFGSAAPRIELSLEGSLRAIDGVASVRYAGLDPVPLADPPLAVAGLPRLEDETHLHQRDLDRERTARGELLACGFQPGDGAGEFRLRDEDAILSWVADVLPRWQQSWQVALGPRLRHVLQQVHVVKPRISIESGLAAELSFQTERGKEMPAAKVREMLALGRRSASTRKGAKVVLSRQIPELVEPLLADLGIVRPEQRIQLDRASELLFQTLRESLDNQLETSGSQLPSIPVPQILRANLRPYQQQGFEWLVDRLQRLGGALLADEMGLGKTLQTLAAIAHLHEAGSLGRALLVVPTTLIGNWREEFEKWVPALEIVTLHGAGRDARRGQAESADCVLTSPATLVRDLAYHLRQQYGMLVVDEASLLRNPDAESSRSLAKLEAQRRLALTGTPVENRPLDLWAIFRQVAPGYLGSRKEFSERYESDEGGAATRKRLRLRISPYVLRRTKIEVAPDLPDKIEIDEWLDLDPEARSIYAAIASHGLEEFERQQASGGAGQMHLLTVLLRLRQCCLDRGLIDPEQEAGGAKVTRLIELLEERSEEGQKTLVFSQFRSFLTRFEKHAEPLGLGRIFRLDGGTRNRAELVRDFQQHQGPAVFLISLKAGGYGLNLTAADTVIHMDPWWNPAAEAQASDRAHRIGQTQPVSVYRLLARDSVEERVRRLQDSKRALIDGLQDETEIPSNWTEADLRGLIG